MIQTIYEPWATNCTNNTNNHLYVSTNENFTVGQNTNAEKNCWLNSSLSLPPEQRFHSLNELVSKIVEESKPIASFKGEIDGTNFNEYNDYDESMIPYYISEGTIIPPATTLSLTTTSSLSSSPLTNVNAQQPSPSSSSSSSSSTSSIEHQVPQVQRQLQQQHLVQNEFFNNFNEIENQQPAVKRLYCEICKAQYIYVNIELVQCLCGYKSLKNQANEKMVKVTNNQNGNNGLQTMPLKDFRRIIGLKDNFKQLNNNNSHFQHDSNSNHVRPVLLPNQHRFVDSEKQPQFQRICNHQESQEQTNNLISNELNQHQFNIPQQYPMLSFHHQQQQRQVLFNNLHQSHQVHRPIMPLNNLLNLQQQLINQYMQSQNNFIKQQQFNNLNVGHTMNNEFNSFNNFSTMMPLVNEELKVITKPYRHHRRTGPANELHIRLEECLYQFKCLETERKKTETDFLNLYPNAKLQLQSNPILRLPQNPSRVDRLVYDSLREYLKVSSLLTRVEELSAVSLHGNIKLSLEKWLDGIKNVQLRRREELINAETRQRFGQPKIIDEKDVILLSSAIHHLTSLTRQMRTSLWCALQISMNHNEISEKNRSISTNSELLLTKNDKDNNEFKLNDYLLTATNLVNLQNGINDLNLNEYRFFNNSKNSSKFKNTKNDILMNNN